jgi:hypothetical protein
MYDGSDLLSRDPIPVSRYHAQTWQASCATGCDQDLVERGSGLRAVLRFEIGLHPRYRSTLYKVPLISR